MENKSVRTAPAIVLLVMALFYHTGESAAPAQPIRITGRVVEGQKPFAGARVELYPAVPINKDALPLKSTRTGPDGTYELLAPESGAYRVVVQAKDRLALEHLAVPVVEEVSLLTAELMRPSTLEIQALGRDGRPLAGLALRVARSMDNARWRHHFGWQPADRQGVTGPDGKLTLPRLKYEELNVYVTDPLYLGQAASGVRDDSVTVRPESRPRTLEVVRPAPLEMVRGKVADAQTGKPIAGALVWSGLPPDLPPVRTAKDGTFGLPVPAAGRLFAVAAPGYEMSEPQPASPAKPVAVALKRTAAIRGQVVDKMGGPIAGAAIQISPGPSRYRNLSSLGYMSQLLSGDDGSFSIPGLLHGGVYRLSAHRQGYGRSEVEVKVVIDSQPMPARIVLGSGATVTGRIVDESGNPVAEAEVILLNAENPEPASLVRTASEATGAFEIPHLIPGTFQVFARRAGYASALRAGVLVPEGDTKVDAGAIVLKAGSAIEGRVTDVSGRAVEGAHVRTWSEHELIDPRRAFVNVENIDEAPPPDARSGPDGLFRIENLERGRRYSLSVEHPAHPQESVPNVEAPTAEPVLIELQPLRTLSGRVVGPDGEPVKDAEIHSISTTGFGSHSMGSLGRTNSAGEFRETGLKPGPLDLQVTASGYSETWWKGVQVPQDRDPEPITITMERGAILEIRARDGEGNPLAGVRIMVWPKTPSWPRIPRHPFNRPATDGDGIVRIDDLAPGEYSVSGSMHGTGRGAEANVRLGPGTTRVDLLFEKGAAISGRVVNEEGEPVPSASVHVQSGAAEGEGMERRDGYSQADGSFEIPGLQEGEYRLTASAKGYGTSEPQRLRLGSSGVEGLEIRLSREASGAISGRVLGLSPQALSRIRVEAETLVGWDNPTSLVDEQGRYRLPGLRSGDWIVKAYPFDGGRAIQEEVVVEPGAEVVLDLQFPEGLTFSGRVLLDGRPLRGAQILAASLKKEDSHAMAGTDFEGRFSLGPLQPGPHLFLVHGAEGVLGTYRTVQLQEGQEIRLDIETGGLQGRILAPGGEPVPDATLQFRVVDPATGQAVPDLGPTIRSDAQGAFEMLSIPTGLYTVVVQKPGYKETHLRLEVRPGVAVQDILLKPGEM